MSWNSFKNWRKKKKNWWHMAEKLSIFLNASVVDLISYDPLSYIHGLIKNFCNTESKTRGLILSNVFSLRIVVKYLYRIALEVMQFVFYTRTFHICVIIVLVVYLIYKNEIIATFVSWGTWLLFFCSILTEQYVLKLENIDISLEALVLIYIVIKMFDLVCICLMPSYRSI